MMKIAVIGAGISGLTAAYLLNRKYDITLYEAADRIGGHTATKTVNWQDKHYCIDTGFIVYNDWTYPNFIKLIDHLGVDSQPTTMGFSVSSQITGLEYSGENLNTLFAQRRNLFSIKHWRMITDILRFNRQAPRDVESGKLASTITLGQYLKKHNYSTEFLRHYLLPMGAAIWSASTAVISDFPLHFFIKFFKNHGLLSINSRPQWRVIKGGSKQYIQPLIQSFKARIRINSPIESVVRQARKVVIKTKTGQSQYFDQVVIATHSDQALNMLADPSDKEIELLGSIPYRNNEVVLHTDTSLLPNNKHTWSSWNYRIIDEEQSTPVLTYNMNILQKLNAPTTFCVTLNHTDHIQPDSILGCYQYAHPVFSLAGIEAQRQWQRINGVNRTWFCGAYWGYGFHEDGVNSALRVANALDAGW